MSLTLEQLQKMALNWSLIIQAHMEAVHSTRLDYVPKGAPDSLANLLSNWSQADPPGYPEPTEVELVTALATVESMIDAQVSIEDKQTDAKTGFSALPGWATWTQAELATYLDSVIGDAEIDAIANLADAKVFLKVLATLIRKEGQAIIYLRNHTMPDLEGN